MSRHDVEADITLDERRLTPGGTATVRIRTTAHEPVKIRGAHVEFVGYEQTQATYVTTTGKTTTVQTATERNTVVEEQRTFQGRAPAGFFGNLKDGALTLLGGGDHEELPEGDHDVVLEVDLPAGMPESFEGKKVKVAYEASIHLDIPGGRDFRHKVTFEAPPLRDDDEDVDDVAAEPLMILYPEDASRGFFDSVFGPEVTMRVELSSTVVRRGGVLTGTIEVGFPDRAPRVRALACALLRRESSKAHGHTDGHTEKIVTERFPQGEGGTDSLFIQFDVRLPDEMIPTCSGAKFTIVHELAISLDVPWAKDPTIRIPITVV